MMLMISSTQEMGREKNVVQSPPVWDMALRKLDSTVLPNSRPSRMG